MSFKKVSKKYGPWAVVTGASSGFGRALATELAQANINLVLIGRGVTELDRLAAELSKDCGVECRVVMFDLSAENCIEVLQRATDDLDVGLLIASAVVVMQHAVDTGACIVTALDFPADQERAKRVRIPWMPAASEHGVPRREWWKLW